jgi:uncharacterized protein YuzE
MREPNLQVTYVRGRPEAAYLRLPRKPGEKSVGSERVEPEMVLDFNKEGRLIGIEIIDPASVTLEAINQILEKYGFSKLSREDLAPLVAA